MSLIPRVRAPTYTLGKCDNCRSIIRSPHIYEECEEIIYGGRSGCNQCLNMIDNMKMCWVCHENSRFVPDDEEIFEDEEIEEVDEY